MGWRALAIVAVTPIAAVAVACHSPSHIATSAPDASNALAPSEAPVPQIPPPTRQEREQEAQLAAMKAALSNWNDATNAHDLERLASIYDERVFYYRVYLAKADVLASKARAFKILTDYHQEISDVVWSPDDLGGELYFTKTWGPPGHIRSLRAKVGLRSYEAGSYVIVKETDEPTESAKEPPNEDCDFSVYLRVTELSFVKNRIAAAETDPRNAGRKLETMGPEPDGRGGTLSSYGFRSGPITDELIVWRIRHDGHVRVTVDGKELAMPARTLKAIKEACKR